MTSAPVPGSVLIYDRIAANRRTTWVLMVAFVAVVTALVALIVLALGLPVGFIGIAGIAIILYAVMSYFMASSVILSISGAHEVTKEQEWEYVRRVENLCIGAGLPMPRTWVLEDTAPNAFATGRDPQHAHVVVTRGLLQKLEPIELEAVLAHELSHIQNYDIRVMTIAAVLVGVVVLLSDFFLRWTYWGAGRRRGSRNRGGGGAVILVLLAIVAAVLAPIVAQALKFAISRQREFLADASGALLCRHPEALARALEKIAADPEPLEAANKATAHLYIYNPLREHQSFLNNLFNTHPPIEERIRLLRSM
ncbi:MAG: protease HtpX [Tepidiforma sp.]|nr:MAG: protease HtpX [Tepidiforma sp.]